MVNNEKQILPLRIYLSAVDTYLSLGVFGLWRCIFPPVAAQREPGVTNFG